MLFYSTIEGLDLSQDGRIKGIVRGKRGAFSFDTPIQECKNHENIAVGSRVFCRAAADLGFVDVVEVTGVTNTPRHYSSHVRPDGDRSGRGKVDRLLLYRGDLENPVQVFIGFSWPTFLAKNALSIPMLRKGAILVSIANIAWLALLPTTYDFASTLLLGNVESWERSSLEETNSTQVIWGLIAVDVALSLFLATKINRWQVKDLLAAGWRLPATASDEEVSVLSGYAEAAPSAVRGSHVPEVETRSHTIGVGWISSVEIRIASTFKEVVTSFLARLPEKRLKRATR